LYEAGVQLGRLLRTIFLADCLVNPRFASPPPRAKELQEKVLNPVPKALEYSNLTLNRTVAVSNALCRPHAYFPGNSAIFLR
jgi:hypothetical protein